MLHVSPQNIFCQAIDTEQQSRGRRHRTQFSL